VPNHLYPFKTLTSLVGPTDNGEVPGRRDRY
jgi:hypothetical protein